jgi:large subunit ribosomal protein L5
MSLLKKHYETEVVPKLIETFKYRNVMQVPKVKKIVLNMGLGEAIQNIKVLETATAELKAIAGQQPVVTKAKKSIAAFKLREGMPIGCMVTLRHGRMYDFLQKLVNVALPRVRDFRGVSSKAFDGRGNYKIDQIKGLNVSIVTSARTDEEGRELLRLLGMPFRN